MKRHRPVLALVSMCVMLLSLWVGASFNQSATIMSQAAERFLTALDETTRARASFNFDDPERLNWHFIPRERKGMPIKEMNGEQRALAFGLLQSGLSQTGSLKATTIMSLEAVLREMEGGRGATRDPELYYFSVFGEPSAKGRWGWRVEGHHLSLNFTLDGGRIVSATPAFFGANPAEVRQGPRKGLRVLADYEDQALALVRSLDEAQRTTAVVSAEAPKDVESNTGGQGGLEAKPPSAAREGITAGALKADQRKLLDALVQSYSDELPDEVADAWLREVQAAGDDLAFAWYGSTEPNAPHGYQLQGPTFQIEFNNTQNQANHIHSVWRNMMDDFGLKAR